ncbi:MAG: aminotransferase [Hyphomicrobiaceae bacterium]
MDIDLGAVRTYDNLHWLHPWEDMSTPGQHNRTIVTRGEGIRVFDETGRGLIDGPGGMWCVQVGYGNEAIALAIAEQAMRMPYNNPFALANEPAPLLSRKLAEIAPGDLDHVFLTTGGSTAVDSAIRFVHFRNNIIGRPRKKIVIAREGGYHGSTYLTASISGKVGNKRFFDHEQNLVDFVPHANPYRRPKGMTVEAFCDEKVGELEAKILELGPENVAAFISEPIQASGGVIVAPEGYLRRCQEVCRKYDVLYISDEVVTGFGRLGHFFSSGPVFGLEPDIVTTAKGLTSGYQPLGAAIISKRLVADVSGENGKGAFFTNGYTYSGHPVACAAALKNTEIFEKTDLNAHVRAVAPHFQARMAALKEVPIVGDVRGMGLVGCVECVIGDRDPDPFDPTHMIGDRIDRHCQALGLLVRPILNMCVFSPPLVITTSEIDEMFDILEKGLRLTMDEMVREGLFRG